MGKKRRWWYISVEKKQKQNSVTIMISGDGKGTISSVKLKLKGESFEKSNECDVNVQGWCELSFRGKRKKNLHDQQY